jgi:hypothetical protein
VPTPTLLTIGLVADLLHYRRLTTLLLQVALAVAVALKANRAAVVAVQVDFVLL